MTYLAKVEGVSKVRGRVDLYRQVFYEEVKEKRVSTGIEHSYSLPEFIVQRRVKSITINENIIKGWV